MAVENHRPQRYEIRIAGAIGEGLAHALAGMRAMRLEPGALLRIEVAREDWDAADIAVLLRERGHVVRSVRRCAGLGPKGPRQR